MLKINGIRLVLLPPLSSERKITIMFSPSTLWNWMITFYFNHKMAEKIHKLQPKNTLSVSSRYCRSDSPLYPMWSPGELQTPSSSSRMVSTILISDK